MADVHSTLSTSLSESLIPKLRQWRKDHYEKSLRHYKKTKEFEKEFIDAQKSWKQLLDKISEYKSAYYSASKTSKLADDAERTATEDQRKKLADKADVARREIGFTKTKYQQAINEAREQRPRYELAMKDVFERTQAFEKKRLDFFKETYDEYLKILETATLDK
jgi:N-acetylmuramoyl-L-alanine amidase CwlA